MSGKWIIYPKSQTVGSFFVSATETPEHNVQAPTSCRKVFVEKMWIEMPVFLLDLAPCDALTTCLKVLIANRPTICLLLHMSMMFSPSLILILLIMCCLQADYCSISNSSFSLLGKVYQFLLVVFQ